jgi:hypothetical protein
MTTRTRKDTGDVEIRDNNGYIICLVYDNGTGYVIAPDLSSVEKEYINNYKNSNK